MRTTKQKNTDIGRAFGNRTAVVPNVYYIGLSTVAITNEASFTEVTSSDYSRITMNNTSSVFTVPVNGVVTNAVEFEFAESISAWGTIHAIGLYDAQTGGNLLYIGKLTTPKTVEAETVLRIKIGALEFAEVDVA